MDSVSRRIDVLAAATADHLASLLQPASTKFAINEVAGVNWQVSDGKDQSTNFSWPAGMLVSAEERAGWHGNRGA
jgi:hypothetical protein